MVRGLFQRDLPQLWGGRSTLSGGRGAHGAPAAASDYLLRRRAT